MTIDFETENTVISLVNSATTDDEKFRVDMLNQFVGNDYLVDWVSKQEVKLLILDGSYGGRSGKEFEFLTTDIDAQDDWHIGKHYDMQGWFRYPVVVHKDEIGLISVREADDKEVHNAYLVVSKKDIRCKSKNLKRAKTKELEIISDKMVEKFVKSFNAICCGKVYYFMFTRPLNDSFETYIVGDVYGDLISAEEVMCNVPFNDKEFDILIDRVLTF